MPNENGSSRLDRIEKSIENLSFQIENQRVNIESRSAVSGLIKTLANEYGPHNVLVNNVCPGYTSTARLEALTAKLAEAESATVEKIKERWASQVLLRRLGQPDEFANLVVFLASERASYITGVSVAVDGGLVKGIY